MLSYLWSKLQLCITSALTAVDVRRTEVMHTYSISHT